jgi:adenine/guanine phosphoribosyltransferase-like PRPP-binding protein
MKNDAEVINWLEEFSIEIELDQQSEILTNDPAVERVAAILRKKAADGLARWEQQISGQTGNIADTGVEVPRLLRKQLRPPGPVAFPSGAVADTAWEFGLLDEVPAETAEAIIEIIAERAYEELPLDLRSRPLVIVCFGYPIHRCGKRLAAKLIERTGIETHVVLAINFFDPQLCCAQRELKGQNVVIFLDVVHSAGLAARLTRLCEEAQPKQLLRLAVIDQGDNSKREQPIRSLWRDQQENRIPLDDYLKAFDRNTEALRFYDPDFARANTTRDLPKELADRSAARETIEREINDIQIFIHRTNALQADRDIAGVHYPWVIELPRLLDDADARAFLLARATQCLTNISPKRQWCLVYPAERSQRAGRWAQLIGNRMGWPVISIARSHRKYLQPLDRNQRKHLNQFDGAVVVDAAIRTGDTLRTFVQLLRQPDKPIVPTVCGFYVFDGLFESYRRSLFKELEAIIYNLFRIPLGRPTQPIGKYCREGMKSTLRNLDERFPGKQPEWIGVVRNYCEEKLRGPRWQPRSGTDRESRLTIAIDEWHRGQQARLERSCHLEKPSLLKQLDVQFALREPKTRMVLRGFLSNSMPPEFIEWCALAVASQNEYDWLDTDWLLLHADILSDCGTKRWQFLAYIFYVMTTVATESTLRRVKQALQQFALTRRDSTPSLFPDLDVVQTRCKYLASILEAREE